MQLQHGRVPIELHSSEPATGRPLLLLHALGRDASGWPAETSEWSAGTVYALDFAGHGESGRVAGGSYYPEYFLGDADLALEAIGEPCVIVGSGIGAYVALMLAGARPDSVLGALLLDGAGLDGFGSSPNDEMVFDGIEAFDAFIAETSKTYQPETDPMVALAACDLRPTDYAASFAEAARPLLFSRQVGVDRAAPEWWRVAVETNSGVLAPDELAAGLEYLRQL